MINASQLTNLEQFLTLFSSHNHSIGILSLIYLQKSDRFVFSVISNLSLYQNVSPKQKKSRRHFSFIILLAIFKKSIV
jgi:hypothetical protein